ncbi:MAG: TIGR02281 family clan AA aspartic protease [Phenylobacterium sp.]
MSNTLRFTMVALVAAASAVVSAGAVIAVAPRSPELRAARAEASIPMEIAPPTLASERAQIAKASDGHFWAEGEVNGSPVRFLVDTGATAVALTPGDAERLGFRLAELKYGYTVVTAGGTTRAAAVKLHTVSVAGAEVGDVDALVIEKGLDTSLLGMSYLGRLSRFEATRQALFLQP